MRERASVREREVTGSRYLMAHYDSLIALEFPHGFSIIEHLAQARAFELEH